MCRKPQRGAVNALVDRFPNLSVIDIGAVLAQVKGTIDQVTEVVELVFLFTLAAGVLVLVAAIHATQDERLREGAVMRVLGARRAQLRFAQLSEFLVIGLIAAFVAVLAANGIAGSIATRVFDLPGPRTCASASKSPSPVSPGGARRLVHDPPHRRRAAVGDVAGIGVITATLMIAMIVRCGVDGRDDRAVRRQWSR